MKISCAVLFLLAACAAPQTPVYAPVAVDMPLAVKCAPLAIDPPPDRMAALTRQSSLAQFTKACAAQTLYDRVYEARLAAVLRECE